MKQLLAIVVMMIFVAMGGFGFLFPLHVDGHGHETGCPFMPAEEVVCSMDQLGHIAAWQKTFIAYIPDITALVSFISLMILVVVHKLFDPAQLLIRPLAKATQNYFSILNPYSILFSKGILNPKAP